MELPVLHGERVTLRSLTEADLDALCVLVTVPGVAEWWGDAEEIDERREDLRQEGSAFAIEEAGALAGWLGFWEENTPQYRHATLDIILGPGHQDRRLGSEALRLAIRWLVERGHHRFTIDPAAHNERAIRAYAAVGFRPVGTLRDYERGPDGAWRDGLLMELLASELTSS